MKTILVKDVMVPLDDVPTVSQQATLVDAARALREGKRQAAGERYPFRVVLVVDDSGRVLGKIGHLSFLKALVETGHESPYDRKAFHRARVDPNLIASMTDTMRLLQEGVIECCARAAHRSVRDAMLPVETGIEENTPLLQAIHTLVGLQTLSVLVKRGPEVVGLLRLADLFEFVAREIMNPQEDAQ